MQTLYFATSSDVKLKQYKAIFKSLNFDIAQGTVIDNTLIEPQYDPESPEGISSLVAHPLRLAARFISKKKQVPYMIEDTMLIIDEFSKKFELDIGLPGADTKNWWLNLGAEGIIELLKNRTNRKAKFVCQIGAYIGGSKYVFASGYTEGLISQKPAISEIAELEFPYSNPYFFHQIFIPNGMTKTMGELGAKEFSEVDYRRKCARNFVTELAKVDYENINNSEQFDLFEG
ncbi:non-canonical purine NTP pyrophosphatase [Pseudoalteromonas sp. XMcav11-Q]|uniref:non-canonical purine NTP pyrophosphatase n=1 Tax=Pseudoalteromonas sp. XMcav11-Q TaxID=3136665 RepID=UPI0032C3EC8F